MDGALRVLVVDDHPGARQALCQVVEATPGLRLEATLGSGESAVAYVAAVRSPLLVVMDIRMPGIGGVAAARQIIDSGYGHRVLLVSSDDDVGCALADPADITFLSKSRVTGRRLLEAWR